VLGVRGRPEVVEAEQGGACCVIAVADPQLIVLAEGTGLPWRQLTTLLAAT
jgi:hypothetical protein